MLKNMKFTPEIIAQLITEDPDVVPTFKSNQIFFAKSKKTPETWSYDHVGFIVGNRFVQMSGHRQDDGVFILNKLSDDPDFESDEVKIVPLGKTVNFTTDTLGSENCGTFVHNVLKNNNINLPLNKIYSVFKAPPKL